MNAILLYYTLSVKYVFQLSSIHIPTIIAVLHGVYQPGCIPMYARLNQLVCNDVLHHKVVIKPIYIDKWFQWICTLLLPSKNEYTAYYTIALPLIKSPTNIVYITDSVSGHQCVATCTNKHIKEAVLFWIKSAFLHNVVYDEYDFVWLADDKVGVVSGGCPLDLATQKQWVDQLLTLKCDGIPFLNKHTELVANLFCTYTVDANCSK